MLPSWSRVTEQFDTRASQLLHSCGHVADSEPHDRPGIKVLPARVVRTEDLGMAAVAKLEDPQTWFGAHGREAQHVLVEVHQLLVVFRASAAPSQTCDIHACRITSSPSAAQPGHAGAPEQANGGGTERADGTSMPVDRIWLRGLTKSPRQ
jgi:hypothetical protein